MKTHAELIAEIQEHFKKIGELLDYLDKVLPEHEANRQVEGAP